MQVATASDEDADDVLRDYELSGDEDSGDEAFGQSGDRAGDGAASSDEDDDHDFNAARAPLSRTEAGRGRAGGHVGTLRSGGSASQKPLERGNSRRKRGRGRGRRLS